MAQTLFRSTSFALRALIDNIVRGDIALPELQRPFVWSNTKVRDLFDSMYRGFPVGYLLFWETGAEVGARQIGVDGKDARVARWLIVDGQQRLTSLYSVLTGQPVVREDYSTSRVRLAFRPRDGLFTVADATVGRDPEYLADVTALWSEFRPTVTGFVRRLEQARGGLPDAEVDRLEDALDRLRDLQAYPFNVVELDSSVQEEQVADVFVRINSEGVSLKQADFILTLMSVFWDKGRRQLEEFSRACKVPSLSGPSPFNWYIDPQPDQLLRVAVAVAFRRAVLKQAYSILRGRDPDTGEVSAERRDRQFARLQQAQEHVLNLTHWHEFLRCLERAGYRGAKMISSENVVLFTYAIWLVGRVDYRVPVDRLREVMARWFFMAHATARYSGSFETQLERDLAALQDVSGGDADGFVAALNRIVDDTLTSDYWTITLPNELATSAARSPALFAYMAALDIEDADALLSTGKVRERLDPAVTARKGIERHHLFPRAYLRDVLGIRDTRRINQIANMAFVEWNDNIAISDRSPQQYWTEQVQAKPQLGADRLAAQVRHHALPPGWTDLAYDEFLDTRRRLMGQVVHAAFGKLHRAGYDPRYPEPVAEQPPLDEGSDASEGPARITVSDLLAAGLLHEGTILVPERDGIDVVAEVDDAGRIVLDGIAYDSPSAAAVAVVGTAVNGWRFWVADLSGGERLLHDLRAELQSSTLGPEPRRA